MIDLRGEPPGISTAQRHRARHRLILRPLLFTLIPSFVAFVLAVVALKYNFRLIFVPVWFAVPLIFAMIISSLVLLGAFLTIGSSRFPHFPALPSEWDRWVGHARPQSVWPASLGGFDPGRPSRWVAEDSRVLGILVVWFVGIYCLGRWLIADHSLSDSDQKAWNLVAVAVALLPFGYYATHATTGMGILLRGGFVACARIIHILLLSCVFAMLSGGPLLGFVVSVPLLFLSCLLVWLYLPLCVERHILLGLPPADDESPALRRLRWESQQRPSLGNPLSAILPEHPASCGSFSPSAVSANKLLLRLVWMGWLAILFQSFDSGLPLIIILGIFHLMGVVAYLVQYSVFDCSPSLRSYWHSPGLLLHGGKVPLLYAGVVILMVQCLRMLPIWDGVARADMEFVLVGVSYALFLVNFPEIRRYGFTREVG